MPNSTEPLGNDVAHNKSPLGQHSWPSGDGSPCFTVDFPEFLRHCSLQKTLGRIDAQSFLKHLETHVPHSWTNFEYLWILKLKGSVRITRIVYHHFWSVQRFIWENISISHEMSTTSSPRPLRTASPRCRSSWLVEWWLIGLTTSRNHFKVKQGTERHWSFLGELEVWKLSNTNRFGAKNISSDVRGWDKVWGELTRIRHENDNPSSPGTKLLKATRNAIQQASGLAQIAAGRPGSPDGTSTCDSLMDLMVPCTLNWWCCWFFAGVCLCPFSRWYLLDCISNDTYWNLIGTMVPIYFSFITAFFGEGGGAGRAKNAAQAGEAAGGLVDFQSCHPGQNGAVLTVSP